MSLLVSGVLSVMFVLTILGGYLFFFSINPKIKLSNLLKNDDAQVCRTRECLAIDENLSRKVNLNLNPCQDFYQYACSSVTDEFSEIYKSQLRIYRRLYNIVKEPVKKEDYRVLRMTKEMFQFCINHDSNVDYLMNFINLIGGWSLLNNNWKEENFSLEKFFAESVKMGYFPKSLFTITMSKDLKNNTHQIMIKSARISYGFMKKIYRIRWPFQSLVLDENALIDHFRNNILPEISRTLNANEEKTKNEFMEFIRVKKLVQDTYSHSPRQNQLTVSSFYNKKTLADLEKDYGNIPWAAIFSGIFKSTLTHDKEFFVIACPKCLYLLNKLIDNISKRSLVSYLMWSLLTETLMDADGKLLDHWLKSRKRSKIEYCADKTFNLFRRVMDYEYIDEHFDKGLKPNIFNFVQMLKNSLKDIIQSSTMMDPETKGYAIDKVNNIIFKIAYDDEIDHKEKLQNYFADLHINSKLYFPSLMNITKFAIEKSLGNIQQPPGIDYLETTNENAAYILLSNAVFLSVSVLGDVFYSKKRPEYLNFGALGFIVSHEMNHGFDISGHLFSKNGTLCDWWQPETRENFMERVKCYEEQYSKFINVETGNKVDGSLTISENLADNGGALVAYNAYVTWLKKKKRELFLPSFKQFTPRQMFWVSFAGIMCSKTSKESVLNRENTDVHAEKRIRVNGVVMNSKDFAKDFRCQSNTPMNPIKKCTIWT